MDVMGRTVYFAFVCLIKNSIRWIGVSCINLNSIERWSGAVMDWDIYLSE